jgi:hypothetical protein
MSVVIEPTVTATLDDAEWVLANAHGRHIHSTSRQINLEGKAGANPTLDIDIQHSAAWIGLCKVCDREPELKINQFHKGADSQAFVRSTSYPTGRLIVREDDRDHDLFVLAIGKDREWTYIGFLTGVEAKQLGRLYSENGRPDCWMVAQTHLRPMSEFVYPGSS